MKKYILSVSATALSLTSLAPQAQAADNIIHEYMSVRTMGMGGVRMTTGLYEENFFSNPARVTANPRSKFELVGLTAEAGSISNISNFVSAATGSGDIVQKLGNTAGNNIHLRAQTDLLNEFIAPTDTRKWGLGVGLFTSTQVDFALHNDYSVSGLGVTDVGLNLTYGRKWLDDKLSAGITVHGIFRAAGDPNFTFVQLLQGNSLSAKNSAGEGAMGDFDVGATYQLPWFTGSDYKFTFGVAVDNVLGGNFSMANTLASGLNCANSTNGTCQPPNSPRSLGFGLAASRELWGPFEDSVLALEFTDIGADSNSNLSNISSASSGQLGAGSVFRTIHIGGETHWKVFALRAGINQGYLGGGLGINLRVLLLDFAYYGEEMSLNAGQQEDRRLAFKLTLQI